MSDEKPERWCKGQFAIVPVAWLKLKGRELRVATAISSYAKQSGKAWPSLRKLTDRTGIHERDLREILVTLRDRHGIIDWESLPGKPNRYQLRDINPEFDPEDDTDVPF